MARPILLLEAATAVGGDAHRVLSAAVGAESGHVASLIHDDIIDGDDIRRGRPSVQHKYGVDKAIVVGDTLIFDMFLGLYECGERGVPAERVARALEVVSRAGIDMCKGQALEDHLTRAQIYDKTSYLRMASLKTAAFFKSACACGGILGGGSDTEIRALASYGEQVGQAFQIIDDLLPYLDGLQGKPRGSDGRNSRPTIPAVLAMLSPTASERMRELFAAFQDGALTEDALSDALAELYRQCGSVDGSRELAAELVADAKTALKQLEWSASRQRLENFADLMLDRTS
jgi:geranylgeranyl diphosphate synthase type I